MNDQRARDAVDHLQAAAIEVIASMRAFLDVAEDLVRDPSHLAATLEELVARGRAFVEPARDPGAEDGDTSTMHSGVTRIRVS